MNFRALDFLFGFAFLIGLYSLNRLSRIREEGDVEEGDVMRALLNEMISPFRTISTVAGVRKLAAIPINSVRKEPEVGTNDDSPSAS